MARAGTASWIATAHPRQPTPTAVRLKPGSEDHRAEANGGAARRPHSRPPTQSERTSCSRSHRISPTGLTEPGRQEAGRRSAAGSSARRPRRPSEPRATDHAAPPASPRHDEPERSAGDAPTTHTDATAGRRRRAPPRRSSPPPPPPTVPPSARKPQPPAAARRSTSPSRRRRQAAGPAVAESEARRAMTPTLRRLNDRERYWGLTWPGWCAAAAAGGVLYGAVKLSPFGLKPTVTIVVLLLAFGVMLVLGVSGPGAVPGPASARDRRLPPLPEALGARAPSTTGADSCSPALPTLTARATSTRCDRPQLPGLPLDLLDGAGADRRSCDGAAVADRVARRCAAGRAGGARRADHHHRWALRAVDRVRSRPEHDHRRPVGSLADRGRVRAAVPDHSRPPEPDDPGADRPGRDRRRARSRRARDPRPRRAGPPRRQHRAGRARASCCSQRRGRR